MLATMIETLARVATSAAPGRGGLRGSAGALPGAAAREPGRKAARRCRKQRGQCLAFLAEFCDGNVNCAARSPLPCCEHFAQCDAAAVAECILSSLD